jgi:periplasmic divalent cation tolerance protein
METPGQNEFCEIQWTSGSLDEARRVSRQLVREGLAASAQIVPWVESIYLLDGQIVSTQESKIYLKALKRNYAAIEAIIRKNSSYQLPEITYVNIDGGSADYLQWIREASASALLSE